MRHLRSRWVLPLVILGGLALVACKDEPPPEPPIVDTDGDGLDDDLEARIGTSPILADTDGDNLSDGEEHLGGGFNPLVADIPKLKIQFVGDVDVMLVNKFSDNCSDSTTSFNKRLVSESTNYSRSDSRATRATVETSVEVSTTVKASAFPPKASAETTAKATASASASLEMSTSFTRASATEAQQEFSTSDARSCFSGSETEGGTVTMGFKISNPSDLAYRLENITMTVLQRRASREGSPFTVLSTVTPLQNAVTLAPGVETGTLAVSVPVPAGRAIELLQNPSGLFFEVGTYDIVDEGGRNFAFVNEVTLSRTALVIVDYADLRDAERYLVATNVDRDADGNPLGVTMKRVMAILGIPYHTEAGHTVDGTGSVAAVLASVDGISYDAARRQLWYVFGSAEGVADPAVPFDDVRLHHGDVIHLVLLRDQDHDDIVDREEILMRCDPEVDDTDGDTLTDYEEAKVGWIVSVGGKSWRVYSDPTTTDFDRDNLDDLGEREKGTDPYDPDTDDDGKTDDIDQPLGGDPIKMPDLKFERRGTEIYATGLVDSDLPIDRITIDWGDGAQYQPGVPDGARQFQITAVHAYAAGDWTATVSVEDTAEPTPNAATRKFEIEWRAAVGFAHFGYNQGWRTWAHPRKTGDVNGDGKADLVGFASDGVYVALANADGTGFLAPTRWVTDFGYDYGWRIGQHARFVTDVNKDGCADIVGFAGTPVRVAISNCQNGFAAPATWSTEFPASGGWNEASYPIFLEDVTRDGYPDIVAISDVTYVAINKGDGTGFAARVAATQEFGTKNGGWQMSAHPRLLVDVNADGAADIVGFAEVEVIVAIARGDGTFKPGVKVANGFGQQGGWRVARHPRLLADVDGDDRPDIVGFGGVVAVALNTLPAGGDARMFQAPVTATTEFSYDAGWRLYEGFSISLPPVHPRYLADMNGDGRADIVGFDNSSARVALGMADGHFAASQIWYPDYGANNWREWYLFTTLYYPRMLADVTGDGRPDIVGYGSGGVLMAPNTPITEIPVTPGVR